MRARAKRPAAGAGRPKNSEPQVQVFSKFAGCNFQMATQEFDYIFNTELQDKEGVQGDLPGSLMVLQNNAYITPNNTIETRPNFTKLLVPPAHTQFTGVLTLVGDRMYAACQDGTIRHGVINPGSLVQMEDRVSIIDRDNAQLDNTWTFLGHADGQLVGMTAGRQLWTGNLGSSPTLGNANFLPTPSSLAVNISVQGTLTISPVLTTACPFRIGITRTHLNRFGPTEAAPIHEFYASKPVNEWSAAAHVRIGGQVNLTHGVTAVDLYFTEGENLEPAFLTRITRFDAEGDWTFHWMGYLSDTSMWATAHLTVPDQNYTRGVPASEMASIDGKLYFWGGTPEHRIWIGGNPGNRFSVSRGTGGGFVDCEPGTGVKVRNVLKYRTQQGASIVTVLCDNENSSREHRFNLVETNLSLTNEQSMKSWVAEKVGGAVGCKSSKGAIVTGDGLYTVSRYGVAITTMAMEQNAQLQVQYISDAIQPVFLKQYGNQLRLSVLFGINDTLYMTFGTPDGDLDNMIFCYNINLEAWWTFTLDIDKPILNMIHIDHEDNREGLGIITPTGIYMLPTTQLDGPSILAHHEIFLETPELSLTQPNKRMQHLSQIEFRFDHFIGTLNVDVVMTDQFGRNIHVRKRIQHDTVRYGLAEYIRIDQVVHNYKISIRGQANMRLTHFMSKFYPKSDRIGMVWGFDSSQSHSSNGSIRRTFSDYNDLKLAIIP